MSHTHPVPVRASPYFLAAINQLATACYTALRTNATKVTRGEVEVHTLRYLAQKAGWAHGPGYRMSVRGDLFFKSDTLQSSMMRHNL